MYDLEKYIDDPITEVVPLSSQLRGMHAELVRELTNKCNGNYTPVFLDPMVVRSRLTILIHLN